MVTYKETLTQALGVLKFNEDSAMDLSQNPDALKHGFLTLGLVTLGVILMKFILSLFMFGLRLPRLFNSYGNYYLFYGGVAILISLVLFLLSFSIMHMFAKLFGGQATWSEYFKTVSNSTIVHILLLVPFIGNLLAILIVPYTLVINGFILIKVHNLTIARAVVVTLIPLAIMLGLSIMFILILFGLF